MERRFPSCFVSCSFSDEDGPVASWFDQVLIALEFDPRKADVPEPRPPAEKIADLIRAADCFVAIVTRRTKVEDTDSWIGPQWVQNEIGMAYQATRPMAIFIEDGVDPGGLGPWATDYVLFARSDLGASAPKVVQYLVNLRKTVTGASTVRTENAPTARAIANELSNFAMLINSIDKPTSLPWQMAYMTARFTGRLYMLPDHIQKKVTSAYTGIEEFAELVRPSLSWRKEETFPQEKLERVEKAKKRVGEVIAEAAMELLQFGYPEEWGALVEAVMKGKITPGSAD